MTQTETIIHRLHKRQMIDYARKDYHRNYSTDLAINAMFEHSLNNGAAGTFQDYREEFHRLMTALESAEPDFSREMVNWMDYFITLDDMLTELHSIDP